MTELPNKIPLTRDSLPTPSLVIDLNKFEQNIKRMSDWARKSGLLLRPHAKTHKSAEIAHRQIAAGAVGICCAKLGEAEALAVEGINDIMITSPVVSAQAIDRLAILHQKIERLCVVVDHARNLEQIASVIGEKELGVIVDIDPGSHRTGVTSAGAAVDLARRILKYPQLRFTGVQFYCGTLQHVASVLERREGLAERAAYLRTILGSLREAGLPAEIVTGGGTGSFAIDGELGVLNEIQPGSYVFMDRQYTECETADLNFEQSLEIDTRVVSANTRGRVTVDAGLKAMATEAGPPTVISGADRASTYVFMGDEHAVLLTPLGATGPPLDHLISLQPPHCDPTVNLYDEYAIVQGDKVVDFWRITARGRSS